MILYPILLQDKYSNWSNSQKKHERLSSLQRPTSLQTFPHVLEETQSEKELLYSAMNSLWYN